MMGREGRREEGGSRKWASLCKSATSCEQIRAGGSHCRGVGCLQSQEEERERERNQHLRNVFTFSATGTLKVRKCITKKTFFFYVDPEEQMRCINIVN